MAFKQYIRFVNQIVFHLIDRNYPSNIYSIKFIWDNQYYFEINIRHPKSISKSLLFISQQYLQAQNFILIKYYQKTSLSSEQPINCQYTNQCIFYHLQNHLISIYIHKIFQLYQIFKNKQNQATKPSAINIKGFQKDEIQQQQGNTNEQMIKKKTSKLLNRNFYIAKLQKIAIRVYYFYLIIWYHELNFQNLVSIYTQRQIQDYLIIIQRQDGISLVLSCNKD
ncbi:hypothetical protein pb186bvf_014689 [Paramecium bursaria]